MRPTPPHRGDFAFFHEMTSRWRDNDVYNHVNNAVYYEYVDTVVNVWIQTAAGLPVPHSGIVGLVVNSRCDYFAPLSFPGRIFAGLALENAGNSSVCYRVGLFADDDETAAADARFTHVYVDRTTRKPVPLPESFRSALQTLKQPE